VSHFTHATPAERHRSAAARLLAIAEQATDWDAPTPVKEWRARDIPEHLRWICGMLAGMGVTLELAHPQDPVAQTGVLADGVQALLDGPAAGQVLDSPMGPLPLADVIDRFYTFDVVAHGWDLARSQGREGAFDEDYAANAFAGMSAMGEALHASGHFGTPRPVADDATMQERLLALIGRDPHWRPEA
jgi:uncharacterized protein (TIGR03086 family)